MSAVVQWCSASCVFEHQFEKHSTAVLPRSDRNNPPSLRITRSTFFKKSDAAIWSRVSLALLSLLQVLLSFFWFALPGELGLTLSFLSTL